jgi:hypothetical protein
MKIQKDILELEIFQRRFTLYTGSEDYTVQIEDITKLALKDDGESVHIYFSLNAQAKATQQWPEVLTEPKYYKLPELFEAASIDIINENENLSKLCLNLSEFN